MPKFKKLDLGIAGSDARIVVQTNIDASGQFYCVCPSQLKPIFSVNDKAYCSNPRDLDNFYLKCATFDELEQCLKNAIRVVFNPEIDHEYVIRFNIESHVSFAEDDNGNIFPNAGYPNAQWITHDEMYGKHHAASASKNGYSLTIGAKVYKKTTVTYQSGKKTISYNNWYGHGGSHLGKSNPAEKLNGWCSYSLPDNCREIPYSDESATFFFDLLMGMAKLSKMIQGATHTEEKLLGIISQGTPLLGKSN